MLDALRDEVPAMQEEAAQLDEAVEFPHRSFARLRALGFLSATLPRTQGGAGFGETAAGAKALLRLFVMLGEASLSVARLYEAHVNALQLICRYGGAALAGRCARDAAAGELFALWVTDPLEGGVTMQPGLVLDGQKFFCSGAGVATRALITAAMDGGTRMLVVELEPGRRVHPSHVKLSGMRAAITGAVDFSGMQVEPDAMIGEAGDYLREPVFSAGAWRGAAGALGGLSALVKLHRAEMRRRGRDADPHQRARFGQLVLAHETARLWMEQAALRACLEDGPADEIVAYVNLARLAVEAACLDAIRLTQRGLGLSAFIDGHPAERVARDLATYLRQPAPDETLVKAAEYYFRAGLPGPG
jgi:alkylation response protein AidB-like acyl-CoA dehydrogenase